MKGPFGALSPRGRRFPAGGTGTQRGDAGCRDRHGPVVTERPRVSVVISVIDPHPVYFPEAVASILEQTLGDLELIIVEEPSVTACAPLLARFDDPRVRHDRHPTRTTLVQQRNRGIALARAELIALLDADDIAEPERLIQQADFMDRHPDIAVLGTQLRLIDEAGRDLGLRPYPTAPEDIQAALPLHNPIGQPSVMYRRSVVQAAGGYRQSDLPATDYELWCRLAAGGARLANLDAPLVRYRIHPTGMKATKLRDTLRATIAIKREYFGKQLSARARLRMLGEQLLLRLPPPLVLRLFVRTSTRKS